MPQSQTNLKLGATADIEIILDRRDHVLSVPVDAIVSDNYIFVIDDDVARQIKIITGFTDGYYTEIQSGVDENAIIILSPEEISDGDKVMVE